MSRREKLEIPQTVAELTPPWFTDALARGTPVTAVETTEIGADVGFMGEVYRCGLTWDLTDSSGSPDDLPASVIVKIPSSRPENRALGEGLRAYEREIEIYRTLHGELGVAMPEHHFSILDPDPAPFLERPITMLFEKLPIGGVDWITQRFMKLAEKVTRRYLLVIEDIEDARPPTQAKGGSLADSKVALGVLAQFHAASWMRHDAVNASNRIFPLNLTPKILQAAYRRNHQGFIDVWGDEVGADTIAKLNDTQERLPEIVDELVAEPWTLVHGDFRLDNVLYRPNGDVVVIDFQAIGWGRAGFDVAYFITTALSPEHKSEETALLTVYHDALIAAGVTDYSFDQLVRDCNLSKAVLAHRFVGGRDFVDSEMAGHDTSFVDLLALRVVGWLDA